MTLQSSDPEARSVPELFQANLLTHPAWPLSVADNCSFLSMKSGRCSFLVLLLGVPRRKHSRSLSTESMVPCAPELEPAPPPPLRGGRPLLDQDIARTSLSLSLSLSLAFFLSYRKSFYLLSFCIRQNTINAIYISYVRVCRILY